MNDLLFTWFLVTGLTVFANGCAGMWFVPPPTARNFGICIGLGALGPVGFVFFVLYARRNQLTVQVNNAK